MTTAEKHSQIDRYLSGADAFDDVLTMPVALLTFRPFPGAWTIHEHTVHFLESDIAAFHRYRKAVAEPGGPVIGYDEEAWTSALNYHAMPLAETVAAIKLLRQLAALHLRSIADRNWTAMSYSHSSAGPVNLEQWVVSYIDHVRFHRELIERNKTLFEKA